MKLGRKSGRRGWEQLKGGNGGSKYNIYRFEILKKFKIKIIQYMLDETGRLLGSLSAFLTRIDFVMLSK